MEELLDSVLWICAVSIDTNHGSFCGGHHIPILSGVPFRYTSAASPDMAISPQV